jgi:hypothetical protein
MTKPAKTQTPGHARRIADLRKSNASGLHGKAYNRKAERTSAIRDQSN